MVTEGRKLLGWGAGVCPQLLLCSVITNGYRLRLLNLSEAPGSASPWQFWRSSSSLSAWPYYSCVFPARLSSTQPPLHPGANQSGHATSLLKTTRHFPITFQRKIQPFYLLPKALPEGPEFPFQARLLQLVTQQPCQGSDT